MGISSMMTGVMEWADAQQIHLNHCVMEWRFKTGFLHYSVYPLGFSDSLKLCFARLLRVSLRTIFCSSCHFVLPKSNLFIRSFHFIHVSTLWRTLHAHSITIDPTSLFDLFCFISLFILLHQENSHFEIHH